MRLLTLFGALLFVAAISLWLPQQPTIGPEGYTVESPVMVGVNLLQEGPAHGGDSTGTVDLPAPAATGEKLGEEQPVNSEYLTSASLLVISGALLAAMLAASRTALGRGLVQLVGLLLSSADDRLGRRFLPVRLSVFRI